MELTDDNLRTLSEYLKQTLSPDPNVRWPGMFISALIRIFLFYKSFSLFC